MQFILLDMSINQRSLSFSLEARPDGTHELIFGSDNVESQFMPPSNYDDRLDWLDKSFRDYLASVNEFERLKNQGK